MEAAYQGMARGNTREAGGGKVTGAVSNTSSLCYIFFTILLLLCILPCSSCIVAAYDETNRLKHLVLLALVLLLFFVY